MARLGGVQHEARDTIFNTMIDFFISYGNKSTEQNNCQYYTGVHVKNLHTHSIIILASYSPILTPVQTLVIPAH